MNGNLTGRHTLQFAFLRILETQDEIIPFLIWALRWIPHNQYFGQNVLLSPSVSMKLILFGKPLFPSICWAGILIQGRVLRYLFELEQAPVQPTSAS